VESLTANTALAYHFAESVMSFKSLYKYMVKKVPVFWKFPKLCVYSQFWWCV